MPDGFDAEKRLERLENKERYGDSYASRLSFDRPEPFDPHDAKLQAGRVIAQLKSGKADQIEQAQEQIKVDLRLQRRSWPQFTKQGRSIEILMMRSQIWKNDVAFSLSITIITRTRERLLLLPQNDSFQLRSYF